MEADEQFEADLQFLLLKSPTLNKSEKFVKVSQNVVPSSQKQGKKLFKGKYKISMEEITKDMDGISFSSDENNEPVTPKQSPHNTSRESETSSDVSAKKAKKKRPRKKKEHVKEAEEDGSPPKSQESAGVSDETTSSLSETSASTKGQELTPSSRSAQSTRTVPKAPQKSFLTAMEPTTSIIGLSNSQILSLPLNDVKLKLLVSSGSKPIQNILKFAKRETSDLFEDYERKKVFLQLCVDVALMESIGFKKVAKKWPQVTEWFGGYPEINLSTTKTRLTPSTKDIHKNSFDYSMLALIGHILIWGTFLQRKAKQPVFTKKYDIQVQNVKECLGGDFLWDRLSQHPKMNAKRWKHVIKFRQSFPFEVNQFMMVLRFMKVDDFTSSSDILA